MNIISILNKLNYTLEQVEVKGRENLDLMLGAMQAIDQLKVILSEMLSAKPKDGDEEDGRQTDNITDCCDTSNK